MLELRAYAIPFIPGLLIVLSTRRHNHQPSRRPKTTRMFRLSVPSTEQHYSGGLAELKAGCRQSWSLLEAVGKNLFARLLQPLEGACIA